MSMRRTCKSRGASWKRVLPSQCWGKGILGLSLCLHKKRFSFTVGLVVLHSGNKRICNFIPVNFCRFNGASCVVILVEYGLGRGSEGRGSLGRNALEFLLPLGLMLPHPLHETLPHIMPNVLVAIRHAAGSTFVLPLHKLIVRLLHLALWTALFIHSLQILLLASLTLQLLPPRLLRCLKPFQHGHPCLFAHVPRATVDPRLERTVRSIVVERMLRSTHSRRSALHQTFSRLDHLLPRESTPRPGLGPWPVELVQHLLRLFYCPLGFGSFIVREVRSVIVRLELFCLVSRLLVDLLSGHLLQQFRCLLVTWAGGWALIVVEIYAVLRVYDLLQHFRRALAVLFCIKFVFMWLHFVDRVLMGGRCWSVFDADSGRVRHCSYWTRRTGGGWVEHFRLLRIYCTL